MSDSPTLSELLRLQEEATRAPWLISIMGDHTYLETAESTNGGTPLAEFLDYGGAHNAYKNAQFTEAARNFDLKGLQTQYEAMREWIANKKYVTHLNECYSYNEEGEGTPITCTCGLSSLDTKARGDEK